MGDLVRLWNSCLCSITRGHFDMWHHRLGSGGLLTLFLHLSEALQALPALRDIRDGPVELLGQRFVRVLGPVVRFQAAKLLVIFLCPGARYFRGSSWVAGIGVSTSRRFGKGFRRGEQASARRDRSWRWSARCWTCWRFRGIRLLGGCSAASLSALFCVDRSHPCP